MTRFHRSKLIAAFVVIAVVFAAFSCASDDTGSTGSDIKLIYDGDIGPDPCDFSTLSLLHEYHNKGMIDLVGVIGATPDPYLASTFSIYNQIYGNNIPIGAYSDGSDDIAFSQRIKRAYSSAILFTTYANPNETIYEKYGNSETRTLDDIAGTVELYRKLLSGAEDNSITIYAAGQLFNFPALLTSQADQYSPLNGEELVQSKVKEFVFMGGDYPCSAANPPHDVMAGAEYNWWALGEKDITRKVISTLARMGKPITYVGFEVGERILVGREIVRRLGRDHPTSEGYYQYVATYDGQGVELKADNPAFDEAGLYYLVEGGLGTYFDRVFGSVQIDENGANTWVTDEGTEAYITLRSGVEDELAGVITDRVTGRF